MESREAIAAWIAAHGSEKLRAAFAAPDFDLFYYHEERRRKEFPGLSLVLPGYRLEAPDHVTFDAMEDEIAFGGETWHLLVPRKDDNGEPYEENWGEVLVRDSWPGGPKLFSFIEGHM